MLYYNTQYCNVSIQDDSAQFDPKTQAYKTFQSMYTICCFWILTCLYEIPKVFFLVLCSDEISTDKVPLPKHIISQHFSYFKTMPYISNFELKFGIVLFIIFFA